MYFRTERGPCLACISVPHRHTTVMLLRRSASILGIFLGRSRFLVGTLSCILNGLRLFPVNPDFLVAHGPSWAVSFQLQVRTEKSHGLGTTAHTLLPAGNEALVLDASRSSPACGRSAAPRTPFPPRLGRGQVPCYPTCHSRACERTPSSHLVPSASVFLRTRDALVKTSSIVMLAHLHEIISR